LNWIIINSSCFSITIIMLLPATLLTQHFNKRDLNWIELNRLNDIICKTCLIFSEGWTGTRQYVLTWLCDDSDESCQIWVLCWKKWRLDRFLAQSLDISLTVSFHLCSIFTFILLPSTLYRQKQHRKIFNQKVTKHPRILKIVWITARFWNMSSKSGINPSVNQLVVHLVN
jgi:hypothetical protein